MDKIEDETHFLFECKMYTHDREELYNFIKLKLNSDFPTSPSHKENRQEIFDSGDLSILNALGKYIKNAFERRENTTLFVLPQQYVFYQKTNKIWEVRQPYTVNSYFIYVYIYISCFMYCYTAANSVTRDFALNIIISIYLLFFDFWL